MIISGNLLQLLQGVPDQLMQIAVRRITMPIWDRQTSRALNSAGLVIKAGGSALVKTGASDCYLLAKGVMQKITAATDMPALVGTVVTATFNVFCFFIDSAGTKTSQIGIAGATLATMKFPQMPSGKALIGFVIIAPTGTGSFVGGTTALDDATVVPGAVYINPVSGFDPYALTGL
jgi:hypothetical protein